VIASESPQAQVLYPVSTGTDHLIAALFAEVTALAARLTQRADLPRAEHSVLEIASRSGPVTVPQIARQRCTSRQNIQVLVDRLEADGRIRLERNPAHKRSALVCLTEKGRAWLSNRGDVERSLFEQIGLQTSEVEIRQAIAVLSKVRGLLSGSVHTIVEQLERRHSPKQLKRNGPPMLESEASADQEFPINLL
jgi:DNA-binding MarR family transcriptional regulator